MMRYFYAWTPLLIVGTLCILALPWLGLIALMIAALVALPALALAIVVVPYVFGHAIIRLWPRVVGRWHAPAAWQPQLVPSTDSNSHTAGSVFHERAVS